MQATCVHPEVVTTAINLGQTICRMPKESWQEATNVTTLSVHRREASCVLLL